MRKIRNKKEEERIRKRNNLVMTILLSLILLFSIGGYSFMGGDSSEKNSNKIIDYNGLKFYNQNNYWMSDNGDFNIIIKNNPNNLSDIKISNSLKGINNYYNKPLYIYSENPSATQEIHNNFNLKTNSIVERIQEACIENKTCDKNLPIKDCKDNLIIIKESEETQIYQQENCVFIKANNTEITKATDKFLLNILGIN